MITSTVNQKVKELVQLQKRSRARNQAGVFIVEGIRMVREIPEDRLEKLYVTEKFYDKYRGELPECRMEMVSPQVFSYISDTKTPQGVLAVVRQRRCAGKEIYGDGKAHILVLDNLQDPGNLGTIFRTAEAAGATGLILSSDCVDIYNPKTIRSTMGAIFRMPFLYVEKLPDAIAELKKTGVKVFAAHLDANSAYDRESYLGNTAFLIGNEGNGLRREVAGCADAWIRIPMAGNAESLNAAVAASVLMFEVSRQRRRQKETMEYDLSGGA